MTVLYETARDLLGLGVKPEHLSLLQVSLRAVVVFIASIAIIRMADKRFLARMTAFDVILGFILGSMLARAVNGSAPLFPTLGGGVVLVGIHRVVGMLARRSHWFSGLVKGHSDLLIQNGKVIDEAMRHNHLSEQDLLEELRLEGNVESPEAVKTAIVERSGRISVVPK